MSMRNRTTGVAVTVVLLSALAGGLLGSRVLATATDRESERSRSYAAALAVVESQYVEPLDTTPLIYGSIEGMLRTLDPHSTFFDPKQYAQMRERQEGHYYGIGISIAAVDGDITVTQLFEGSPAYRAGIRRGDVIAFVPCAPGAGRRDRRRRRQTRRAEQGQHEGLADRPGRQAHQGPEGHDGRYLDPPPGLDQLIDLTVERDEINITTVRTAFMIAPGTGYVRLQEFSETTDTELSAALKKLKAAGMQRLLLDIRDNGGGPLNQAIAVANHFLHKGQMIVYTKGRVENSDENYRAVVEGDYTDLPLIVLTSRQSASASEIVTGSMQDHDRGLIVGETTFGKALVQSVYSIEGAGLALTTAHYYTPSGRLIQRPWDGAFDEYLTYALRDQSASRAHPASELKYTDGGRKVYGGGGIEPDHFIGGAIEGFNVTPFTRTLFVRGAFVELRREVHQGRRHAAGREVRGDAQGRARMGADRRDARGVPRLPRRPSTSRSTTRRSTADRAFIKAHDPLRGGQRPVRRRRGAPEPSSRSTRRRRARSGTSTKPGSCSSSTPRSRGSKVSCPYP